MKSLYASKTVWLNLATAAVGLVSALVPIVPPQAQPYLLALVGAVNLLLRALTAQPLALPWR